MNVPWEGAGVELPPPDELPPPPPPPGFTCGGVTGGGTTTGGVGGCGTTTTVLFTVTVIGFDVFVLPAWSRAVAVIVCVPLDTGIVFQVPEYGDTDSSVPRFTPSILNCTPTTPTLSDAVAARDTLPDTVVLFVGDVMDIVGNVVSGVDNVLNVEFSDVVVLPDASVDITL